MQLHLWIQNPFNRRVHANRTIQILFESYSITPKQAKYMVLFLYLRNNMLRVCLVWDKKQNFTKMTWLVGYVKWFTAQHITKSWAVTVNAVGHTSQYMVKSYLIPSYCDVHLAILW
eukprot:120717_1